MKWEVMQLVNKSYQIVDQSTWSVAVYHFRIKGEGWEELLKRRGVMTFLLWKGGLFEQFNVTWSGRSCSLWINHIRSWISPLEESQSTISESRGRGEGSFLRRGGVITFLLWKGRLIWVIYCTYTLSDYLSGKSHAKNARSRILCNTNRFVQARC